MNDESKPGEGGARTPGGGVPPDAPVPGGRPESPEDALRSLERLEALAKGEEPPKPPGKATASAAPRRRTRPRMAAAPRPAQTWARIAAPVAFLVAVIVVVSLLFQSFAGDGGGQTDVKPTPKASKSATKSAKPSPKASATKSAKASASPSASSSGSPSGVTKVYVIKAGDTLTAIAARFDTSVAQIEELNPDADLTTLQPGQKLNVPAP
jgi:LysM repeat protein